jgi:hypothetical protein
MLSVGSLLPGMYPGELVMGRRRPIHILDRGRTRHGQNKREALGLGTAIRPGEEGLVEQRGIDAHPIQSIRGIGHFDEQTRVLNGGVVDPHRGAKRGLPLAAQYLAQQPSGSRRPSQAEPRTKILPRGGSQRRGMGPPPGSPGSPGTSQPFGAPGNTVDCTPGTDGLDLVCVSYQGMLTSQRSP